ncbi:Hypothetical protein CINCED_3A007431 [Cinara cedri]|uniref:Uncharacterized protein n=1 Tax=Cinara cedri TaxID=506608 RepID=A0A5E4NGT5_9HEMI|nr:Hypothetical protein CINCED_3A007431 [Cinara cedri]
MSSYQLERVQRKFLRFASFVLKIDYLLHDYTTVLAYLQLAFLADRRHNTNLTFINNVLNGKIDSP